MTQQFWIPGILPNLNDMLAAARKSRGKWQAFAQMKVSHEDYIVTCIKKAKLKPMHFVHVTYHWLEPNAKRDKDNVRAAAKFINDALVTANILPNDGWNHIGELKDVFYKVEKQPGVKVELIEA